MSLSLSGMRCAHEGQQNFDILLAASDNIRRRPCQESATPPQRRHPRAEASLHPSP